MTTLDAKGLREIAAIIDPESFSMTPEHYGLSTQAEFEKTLAYGAQLVAIDRAKQIVAYLAAVAEPVGYISQLELSYLLKERARVDVSIFHETFADCRPLFAAPIPVSITDEMVERAARGAYVSWVSTSFDDEPEWERLEENTRKHWRIHTRAALEAAHTGGKE